MSIACILCRQGLTLPKAVQNAFAQRIETDFIQQVKNITQYFSSDKLTQNVLDYMLLKLDEL